MIPIGSLGLSDAKPFLAAPGHRGDDVRLERALVVDVDASRVAMSREAGRDRLLVGRSAFGIV